MSIHIISFTEDGASLSLRLREQLVSYGHQVTLSSAGSCVCADKEIKPVSHKAWTEEHFVSKEILVFIGACGIAVRSIAPYVRSKVSDPAVIVLDEKGQFVIPLLSGHLGQANEYAVLIARATCGVPVLTTATDVNGLFAVDVCAVKSNCTILDFAAAKYFSARLLKEQKSFLFIPPELRDVICIDDAVPPELSVCEDAAFPVENELAGFTVSPYNEQNDLLQLVPRSIVIGVGCRRHKDSASLASFVQSVLDAHDLRRESAAAVASIDLKKDEPAVMDLAESYGVPLETFCAETLSAVAGAFSTSSFVQRTVGVDNVCERSAIAAGCVRLLVRKTCDDGMTVAIGIRRTAIKFSEKGL